MIVLGIDPGTAAMGYGVVDRTGGRLRAIDYGCITTTPDQTLPERLRVLHEHVAELIETHRPDVVAVERLFFSRNAQTAFAVGQARGVVLLAAAQADVPVREATPNEVKMAVTGYGAADKEQVGRMVAVILQLPEVPHPDDTSDALAIAIAIATSERTVERRAAAGRCPAHPCWIGPPWRRSPAARRRTSGPCARRWRPRPGPPGKPLGPAETTSG